MVFGSQERLQDLAMSDATPGTLIITEQYDRHKSTGGLWGIHIS